MGGKTLAMSERDGLLQESGALTGEVLGAGNGRNWRSRVQWLWQRNHWPRLFGKRGAVYRGVKESFFFKNLIVGQLREVSNKANNAELKLFLEVESGQDLRPIPPPLKSKEEILLFFKLYDPLKEELRYVGRLFVKSNGKPAEILTKLNELAGFSPDEEIELFEEIKFEPNVMCERIDKKLTFRGSQLEDGDIICFQKSTQVESSEQCRYPDVPSFLEYVHNRQVVRFRSLEKPKEDEFCLELSKLYTYDDVVERLARHLGLDDPSKIRLTSHNCYSQQPKPQPIKYRGMDHLSDMLVHYNQTSDILYYEVLDIPLPELQGLKTLKVAFHDATKDEVVIHTIRLPKQSTVGDVINDLKGKVELSHPNVELRLLEVFYHKIYKIFPLNEKIENINDQYWTLRAEEDYVWAWIRVSGAVDEKGSNDGVDEVFADSLRLIRLDAADVLVLDQLESRMEGLEQRDIVRDKACATVTMIPEEEKNLGPHDRLIHVYHFMKDTAQNQVQVQNFGEPFFLVIHESETLAEVKVRIQKKLQIPEEEFSKWNFAFLSLGRPEYLQDSDVVSSRFQRRDVYGAWEQYLGLEHSDNTPKRSYAANQRTKLSTKTGMLIAYTPALLASAASFVIFPNEGFRFLLVNSALSIHFFKRLFEVLFIHKYSSVMYLDVAIPISLSYFISTSTMIYAQHLTLGFPEPPLDLKDAGISMFLMGISGNLYHHYLLSKLRKRGDKGYKIPKGGLFDLVICPHYLFEILGFIGISCISQTLYAFSFTLGTTIYLMGRSYATRKWYLTKFQDFPKNIKALIPFVL
ncbi:hypothetical protein TEA_020854 [Camellia sinensis var. sinensis]|uniref:ubiquitinyl hydrolase 1 n=1 Tax=Camellia sinensis var. sinensis TaxID=542762 RepID=A0A4S4EYI8_CAMSN|nr:hypothetical protein TEA_020854 [Camellia sinensis var. sinensis]